MSDLIDRAEAARRFPKNTCGASRHAEQIGVALVIGEPYPMLTEEPAYCGESILSVVASLWEARTEIECLTAERNELRRQLDEAERDAERYRWLRTQPNDTSAPRIDVVHWTPSDESINEGEGLRLDALDAAIDAAMGLTRPAEGS